ncbi:MAG TPA: IS4 family transposase [Bacteroidia bacterium]|nr:IS4 family transposase [Bacteroidia bacterium]
MNITSNFSSLFDEKIINQLAHSCGLIKRNRKLNGLDLFITVLCSVVNQVPSYNIASTTLFTQRRKDVSRQRLHKVISSSTFSVFFKQVMDHIWQTRIDPSGQIRKRKFKRVLIQDSTILKLPKRLFKQYSGVANAAVSVANCRVQLCFDLMSNLLQTLSIDSYSINDAMARNYIKAQKGDMVIRDRGYFALDQFIKFSKEGVFFIVRTKSNNKFYDRFGKPINLVEVLSKQKTDVLEVRLTSEEGPMFYLFAQRVSDKIAAERCRSAKLSAKGRTLSKNTIEHLKWSTFLTNLEPKTNDFNDIWQIYSLRWRIEIIFKALKSHLNLDSIHNVSSNQLHIIIHARIALIFLITNNVYKPLQKLTYRLKQNKQISLIKLVNVLIVDLDLMTKTLLHFCKNKRKRYFDIIDKLIKASSYDSRNRPNYKTTEDEVILS